jgi:sn-glycerol 3-phosphate transport system permease protein
MSDKATIVENTRILDFCANFVLGLGILVALVPLYFMVTTASSSMSTIEEGFPFIPGDQLLNNLIWVLYNTPISSQLLNSFIVSLIVTIGSCTLSFCTAAALIYFNSRFKLLIFGLIMGTLMLPLEVRIVPTYAVAANLLSPLNFFLEFLGFSSLNFQINLLDTYLGLSLPLLSSATGTFMFRQFLMSLPPSLVEAAHMDGAGPIRFMRDILAPLSIPTFAALGILTFLTSWNQYLWPLLASTDGSYLPAVAGVSMLKVGPDTGESPRYHYQMAATLLVILPPLLVVAISQKFMRKYHEVLDK